MIDKRDLIAITELPGVASACGIPATYIQKVLPQYDFWRCEDGYLLATPKNIGNEQIKLVYVTHLDEIGGMLDKEVEKGVYECQLFCQPQTIAHRQVILYRYDAQNMEETLVGESEIAEDKLLIRADGVCPYFYFFTYKEQTVIYGDRVTGKALDPRAAVYCLMRTAEQIQHREVGFIFAYSEEVGCHGARKAATHFVDRFPNLSAVINVDLPILGNVDGIGLEDVGIRLIEGGRTPIDPCATLKIYEQLTERGVEVKLATAKTGSQTSIFGAYFKSLSIAFPARGGHTARGTVSLKAIEKCEKLLLALVDLLI